MGVWAMGLSFLFPLDTEAFVTPAGEERILRIIIQHILYQNQWNFDIIYVNLANLAKN